MVSLNSGKCLLFLHLPGDHGNQRNGGSAVGTDVAMVPESRYRMALKRLTVGLAGTRPTLYVCIKTALNEKSGPGLKRYPLTLLQDPAG